MEEKLISYTKHIETSDTLDFQKIYEEFYTKIYRYTAYRIYNQSDVEDIVSQTFLKVYKKLDTYKPNVGNISQWIFTIAANTVRDYYRRNSLRKFISFGTLNKEPEDSYSMEENFEKSEEHKKIKSIIKTLPEREQNIISLKYGAELSYEEIGKILKLKPNNVGVILHRSLDKIKKSMEEYYEK